MSYRFFRIIRQSILIVTLLLSASNLSRTLAAGNAAIAFPVDGAGHWKISGSGARSLKAENKEGVLLLTWPGGAGEAIIEHTATAPVTPELLSEGFLRYTASLNVLKQEYGAELGVQLLPINKNGKPAPPYLARSVQYGATGQVTSNWGTNEEFVAPPGQWATVDFNYKAPANIAAVKPRFVLRGNAMTVAIQSVTIGKGLTWERGRPKVTP